MDARTAILRAKCFPWRVDKIKLDTIEKWLASLQKENLILIYGNGEHLFLQMVTWANHQQTRANKSKYPAPNDQEMQLLANDINGYHAQSDSLVIDIVNDTRISEPNGFNDWMKHYPKQSGKAKARTYWLKLIDSKKWTAEQLITCADNYSALMKKEGREQRYIKQADGFLNPANGIFEDYLDGGIKEPSTHIPYKSAREQLFGEDA